MLYIIYLNYIQQLETNEGEKMKYIKQQKNKNK